MSRTILLRLPRPDALWQDALLGIQSRWRSPGTMTWSDQVVAATVEGDNVASLMLAESVGFRRLSSKVSSESRSTSPRFSPVPATVARS